MQRNRGLWCVWGCGWVCTLITQWNTHVSQYHMMINCTHIFVNCQMMWLKRVEWRCRWRDDWGIKYLKKHCQWEIQLTSSTHYYHYYHYDYYHYYYYHQSLLIFIWFHKIRNISHHNMELDVWSMGFHLIDCKVLSSPLHVYTLWSVLCDVWTTQREILLANWCEPVVQHSLTPSRLNLKFKLMFENR